MSVVHGGPPSGQSPSILRRDFAKRVAGQVAAVVAEEGHAVSSESLEALVTRVLNDSVEPAAAPSTPRGSSTLPEGVLSLATVDRPGLPGRSVKLGNATLDLRALLLAASSGVLGIQGLEGCPSWTVPLTILSVLGGLVPSLEVNIEARSATVLWVLALEQDGSNEVPGLGLLQKVNDSLSEFSLPSMTSGELQIALENLVKLSCIERSGGPAEMWRVRERVRVGRA